MVSVHVSAADTPVYELTPNGTDFSPNGLPRGEFGPFVVAWSAAVGWGLGGGVSPAARSGRAGGPLGGGSSRRGPGHTARRARPRRRSAASRRTPTVSAWP